MNTDTTISVNGGPEVTMDMFKKAADMVVKKAAEEQFPNLKEFFSAIDRREDEISEMRADIPYQREIPEEEPQEIRATVSSFRGLSRLLPVEWIGKPVVARLEGE